MRSRRICLDCTCFACPTHNQFPPPLFALLRNVVVWEIGVPRVAQKGKRKENTHPPSSSFAVKQPCRHEQGREPKKGGGRKEKQRSVGGGGGGTQKYSTVRRRRRRSRVTQFFSRICDAHNIRGGGKTQESAILLLSSPLCFPASATKDLKSSVG